MTAKRYRTKDVKREDYNVYEKKAGEFLAAMRSSLEAQHWDAAVLNAVHCAISSADALLVYSAGVRSSGESHHDVVGLLELHVKDDQASQKAKTLAKIIDNKNLAAYEARELREPEAQELAKITQRFYDWAKSLLLV